MRRWTVVCAVVALAAVGLAGMPLGAAQEEEVGIIYLTDTALEPAGSGDCPQGINRYAMGLEQPDEGEARPSWPGLPGLSCVSRFLYEVTSPFTMADEARVVLRLRCDPAAVGISLSGPPNGSPQPTATVQVILSPDPNAKFEVGGSDIHRLDAGLACTGEDLLIDAPIATGSPALLVGDALTLSLVITFSNTPPGVQPAVTIVVGEEGSRIEAVGIPTDRTAMPGIDTRPTMFFTAETGPEVATTAECRDIFVHLLARDLNASGLNSIQGELALPASDGCDTSWGINATEALEVQGTMDLDFWFQCTEPTVGGSLSFVIRLRVLDFNGASPVSESFETAGRGTIATCPTAPTRVQVRGFVDPVIDVEPGDWLVVGITAIYLNHPEVYPAVRFLVGPEHASQVRVAGLPAPMLTESRDDGNATGTEPPEQRTPWPSIYLALAATLVAILRRH